MLSYMWLWKVGKHWANGTKTNNIEELGFHSWWNYYVQNLLFVKRLCIKTQFICLRCFFFSCHFLWTCLFFFFFFSFLRFALLIYFYRAFQGKILYVDLVVEISDTQKYMCMKDEMYLSLHFFLNILAANFRNARNNAI